MKLAQPKRIWLPNRLTLSTIYSIKIVYFITVLIELSNYNKYQWVYVGLDLEDGKNWITNHNVLEKRAHPNATEVVITTDKPKKNYKPNRFTEKNHDFVRRRRSIDWKCCFCATKKSPVWKSEK